MSNRRTPAWERLMESKGLGSYRRLADRSGISHEAVRRVVLAQPASDTSIRAVAAALSVDVELVRKMRGEAEFDPREWEPPESSRMLTDDERAALSRLIGVITTGRNSEGSEEHVDGSASKNQAPVSGVDYDEGMGEESLPVETENGRDD